MSIRLGSDSFASLEDYVADACARFDCSEDELPILLGEGPNPLGIIRAIHEHRGGLIERQRELYDRVTSREKAGGQALASENHQWDKLDARIRREGDFINATVAAYKAARGQPRER
jgi:hypothetical protein